MTIGGWVSSMASKVFSRPIMCSWMSRVVAVDRLNILSSPEIPLIGAYNDVQGSYNKSEF